MKSRAALAQEALRRALRLRREHGFPSSVPVCPVDLAESQGVEVRFVDIPSMEAMYRDHGSPTILINAQRPPGRQVFSCAHELGHHEFGHGSRIDEGTLDDPRRGPSSDEEYLAGAFAGYLLMPKAAVERALVERAWSPGTATPAQCYVAAGVFGVSYEAFITQLRLSLNLIPAAKAKALLAAPPHAIRASLLGKECSPHLVVVDKCWAGRAIDVHVGDTVLAPPGATVDGNSLVVVNRLGAGAELRAVRPGICRLLLADGSSLSYARVARAGYTGRAVFRHLADEDDE